MHTMLPVPDLHEELGVRRRGGWGHLQHAEGFHQRDGSTIAVMHITAALAVAALQPSPA